MLRRLVLPCLLLGPLLLSVPARASATVSVVSALQATPYEGHGGDVIWLSGTGLHPNTRYYVLMACPTWTAPDVWNYGNFTWTAPERGPKTDANGQFVRYKMQALRLHHLSSSPCGIYVATGGSSDQGGTGIGPDIPASYEILAQGETPRPCAVHICGSVTPAPRRAHSGHFETITVESTWGGAWADTWVYINGTKPLHKLLGLDWHGHREWRFRIPAQAESVKTAHVFVQFRLGKVKGTGRQTSFTIFR